MKKRHKTTRIGFGDGRKLLFRLIRDTVPENRRLFLLSWVWVGAGAATTAGLALSTRYLVNSAFVGQDGAEGGVGVWSVTAAIIALSLAKGGASYFQSTTAARIRRALMSRFQIAQFERLLQMEPAYFGGRHASEFVSDLLYATRGAAAAVLTVMTGMLRDALTLVFLVGVMVSQDPLMSLAAAGLVPVVLLMLAGVTRRIRKISAKQARLNAELTAVATETVEGIKVIKSYGVEAKALRGFRKAVARLERGGLRINHVAALSGPILETLGGVMIGLFVLYASWQSVVHGRSPGEFVAFISAFLFAYEPAKRLANVHIDLHKQLVAVAQYYTLLDRASRLRRCGAEAGPAPVLSRGDIAFRGVGYSHAPGTPALQDVTLDIAHGERVAIAGRSGSGKTTLVNLVLGFLQPQEGQVLIDGRDVTAIPYDSLRRGVALTAQEVFLFEGSIRENILDGNPGAPEPALTRAAEAAQVMAFAAGLPEGLDTQVGPNGALLSGGQRQRVTIARALIKDSPVLILDEATAALDGEGERAVMAGLLDQPRDRTVLCVSHRFSTIRDFDRVIVLDAGRVVEDGPVAEVAARSALFRSIFHLGPEESTP